MTQTNQLKEILKNRRLRTCAVIVAGGSGSRMNSDIPKQFITLEGKPIIQHTLEVFERCPDIDDIVVVCPPHYSCKVNDIAFYANIDKLLSVVKSGETRQESAYNGIKAAYGDIILIHDAVRPFVTSKQIHDVVAAAKEYGAAALCRPITDTVKKIENGCVSQTVDRATLGAIQTPQCFRADIIIDAHKAALEKGITATDDCALCEMNGVEIHTVPGDNLNIKITTPDDLILAEGILNSRRENALKNNVRARIPRTGLGYDVHKFDENRLLILGGVHIPYELGLLGHSDADVLLHAIMDAMLGSASLGDIGTHFPDTDARWKGVSSMKLLSMVGDLLGKYGYTVINIDATIIAQKPKLMPYIADMQRNISETLLIPQSDVSIKATTTEELGFCGRGEGIAAEAVCTIIKEYDAKVRPLKF